jgi:hypothetical protein
MRYFNRRNHRRNSEELHNPAISGFSKCVKIDHKTAVAEKTVKRCGRLLRQILSALRRSISWSLCRALAGLPARRKLAIYFGDKSGKSRIFLFKLLGEQEISEAS